MAKPACVILGMILLIIGAVGFLEHGVLGMRLSPVHNFIHFVSGLLAVYFGWQGTSEAARSTCIVLGLVYGLLGTTGFLFGSAADYVLTLIPNQLVLGTMDHVLHLILGAVFLASGFARQPVTSARRF